MIIRPQAAHYHGEISGQLANAGGILMKNILPILVMSILMFGCAKQKQYPIVPVDWKTLPEFNVSYDKAWSTVIDVITEQNIKLDVVQKDAGYIKSTAMSWNGQSFTLSVKFYNKTPVIIKLQTMGTLYKSGRPIQTGVPSLEKVILDEIEGRLRKIPILTAAENVNKTDKKGETVQSNPKEDTKAKLRKLQELYKEDLITKEEYDSERQKVLDSM